MVKENNMKLITKIIKATVFSMLLLTIVGEYSYSSDELIAYNNTLINDENTPIFIQLTSNHDSAYFVISKQPEHGQITGTPPKIAYTPFMNYYGNDSFNFYITLDGKNSNVATVDIIVNPSISIPVANDQEFVITSNSILNITLEAEDIQSLPLEYTICSSPSNGFLKGEFPTIQYIPNIEFYGLDTFTYKVNNGRCDSKIAKVTIVINPSNDDALTAKNQNVETFEAQPITITLNGTGNFFSIQSQPIHGSLSGDSPNIIYTPENDYVGYDTFSYYSTNGDTVSNIAYVTIRIKFQKLSNFQQDGFRNKKIIFAQGSAENRFWEDTYITYKILQEHFLFSDDEIYLLAPKANAPQLGINFNDSWIDAVLNKQNLNDKFNSLSKQLDDDDLLFFIYTGHGGGFYGKRTKRPYWPFIEPNNIYQGPINETDIKSYDDPDYCENSFKTELIQCGRAYFSIYPSVKRGMNKWLPMFRYYMVRAGDEYYRYKLVSNFNNLKLRDGSTASDNDVFLEKIINYAKCDSNRNRIIEENEIDNCNSLMEFDGTVNSDGSFGLKFSENEWSEDFDIEEGYHPYYKLNGNKYCLIDLNLDNTIDIVIFNENDPQYQQCLNGQINPEELSVVGVDMDNDGYSDYYDINGDGDFDDWISFDETISGIGTDDDMRNLFSSINQNTAKIFLTQSCFGGGLLSDLSEVNTIAISASEEDDTSTGNYFIRTFFLSLLGRCEQYGVSSYDFACSISPYNNLTNKLDTDSDGLVSITEAFYNSYYLRTDSDFPLFEDNADKSESYGHQIKFFRDLATHITKKTIPEGIYGDSII